MNMPILNACFWSYIFNSQGYTITLGVQWLYKRNTLENVEYDGVWLYCELWLLSNNFLLA